MSTASWLSSFCVTARRARDARRGCELNNLGASQSSAEARRLNGGARQAVCAGFTPMPGASSNLTVNELLPSRYRQAGEVVKRKSQSCVEGEGALALQGGAGRPASRAAPRRRSASRMRSIVADGCAEHHSPLCCIRTIIAPIVLLLLAGCPARESRRWSCAMPARSRATPWTPSSWTRQRRSSSSQGARCSPLRPIRAEAHRTPRAGSRVVSVFGNTGSSVQRGVLRAIRGPSASSSVRPGATRHARA